MSLILTYQTVTTVVETLAPSNAPFANATKNQVTHDGLNTNLTLNATSTPPASLHAAFKQLLTAGAASLILTALVGTNGITVNGNGLKIRAVKFKAATSNVNPITVKFGGANPYNLFGSAWQVVLSPGQELTAYFADAAPVIGAGANQIDLAGTGTQELDCEIVIG